MIIRVGIPHRGGKLAFHAFNQDYPAMVSANAFWTGREFRQPDATDLHELDLALDSAGFMAAQLWKAKGPQAGIGGIFPWTYEQYAEFALLLRPAWWSQPDLCCEPELAASQEQIDFRVNATATFLEGTLQIVDAWSQQHGEPLPPPMPIVQGWTADDYRRSLDLMLQVWHRWHPEAPGLIGVGSVCRRHLRHPQHGLMTVINAIESHLPASSKLHLFGVKGAALSELKMFECIESVDSMAYDFKARMRANATAISNSIEHRAETMTDWMDAASRRLEPAAGDQFRIAFSGY